MHQYPHRVSARCHERALVPHYFTVGSEQKINIENGKKYQERNDSDNSKADC